MKYRLLEKASVYSATEPASPILAELRPGDVIQVTDTTTSGADKWDAVTLLDGRTGYLSSKTKGHTLRSNVKRRLDGTATVHSLPSSTSSVVAALRTGDEITVQASITVASTKWDAVLLSDGRPGYISGKTNGAPPEPDGSPKQQPGQNPLLESIGAGAFAGLGAGLAAHYFAAGKLTFPIWIAAYVLVISNVKNKLVATIVFVPIAALMTVVLRSLAPSK
jgi:hypothetical protein